MQPVFLWDSDRKIKVEQPKQKFRFVLAAPEALWLFCFVYIARRRLRTRWHQWDPFKPRWLQLGTETQHSDSEGQQAGVLEINHLQNKNEGMDFYIMSQAKK